VKRHPALSGLLTCGDPSSSPLLALARLMLAVTALGLPEMILVLGGRPS
jgi:hypothetical protein